MCQFGGYILRRSKHLATLCEESTLEKILMLRKIEGKRGRWRQRLRWLDGIMTHMDEFEQTQGDNEGQGNLMCCSSWGQRESDVT